MVDTYQAPFSDNVLIYDNKRHRYLLSRDYVINVFGECEISDDIKWQQLVNQLSDNVYTFIYSFKQGRENYDHLEYELACNQFYREVLADVLIWQYEYAITSGGDLVQLQHDFNPANDKMMDIKQLRGELMISTKGYLRLLNVGLLESTFRTSFDYDLYRVGY